MLLVECRQQLPFTNREAMIQPEPQVAIIQHPTDQAASPEVPQHKDLIVIVEDKGWPATGRLAPKQLALLQHGWFEQPVLCLGQ
jgi:hypothetical protein